MRAFKNILVIRFSSLGDVLLTTPVIRGLRQRYPGARIDVLVKPLYADLLRFNPHVTSVITFEDGADQSLAALGGELRRRRYDLVLDLHRSLRSNLLRPWLWRARRRSVRKFVVRRYLLVRWKWNTYRGIVPVPDRYRAAAADLGVQDDGEGLELCLPDETLAAMRARMERLKIERFPTVIGFAPTARHFTKCWPAERFVACGVALASKPGVKILVFGAKDEAEYCGDIVHLINTSAGGRVAENLSADSSLLESAAAMDYCKVVLCNDSGLMHLASARRRPVVALFGSTVKEFGFAPYRTPGGVIEHAGLPCRPCSHIGRESCPLDHFHCMTKIEPGDVLDRIQSFLAA
jgi:lipopolysaccharide heptosyltransferase II